MPVYMSKLMVLETQEGSKNITMVYKCQYILEEMIWDLGFVAQLTGSSWAPGQDWMTLDVSLLFSKTLSSPTSVRTTVNDGAGY